MTNIDIKNAYVGTTEVKAMYLGSTKVWPVETLSRPKIGDFVYGDKTWSTELDSSKTCVGVITDVRSKDFDFIALREVDTSSWATTNQLISGAVTETEASLALCDFAGKTNSQKIVLTLPTQSTAAHKCLAYSTEGFGAYSWFLPSCGQWNVARLNKVTIEASISAAGGTAIKGNSYWTSTQVNEKQAWYAGWGTKVQYKGGKSSVFNVRPFCTYEYNPVPNGVFIYDKDGNRYTKEEWVSSGKGVSAVCGIGISTDTNSFMVSTSKSAASYAFGGQGTLISNVPMLGSGIGTQNIYRATHGFIYTTTIISQLGPSNAPAAKYAMTYVFGNDQVGYLPSFGEVTTLYSYKTQVEEILSTLGLSLWGSVSIQTCTQYGAYNNAVLYWPDGASTQPGKGDGYTVLPFTLLPFKERII